MQLPFTGILHARRWRSTSNVKLVVSNAHHLRSEPFSNTIRCLKIALSVARSFGSRIGISKPPRRSATALHLLTLHCTTRAIADRWV